MKTQCEKTEICQGISFTETGRGIPVLFLHGAMLDRRMMMGCYEPVFEKKAGYRRIYPDIPGMGMSPAPGVAASSDALLSILRTFVSAQIGTDPFIGQFFFKDPQPGDQIFFSNDGGKSSYHTGLVEKVSGGRVYTIEGNTSSAPGVVENGGCVRDKSYRLTYSKIGGYGRPNYSIITEEDDEMDLAGFKKLYAEMRAELKDNDSSQYSEEARTWAVSSGLIAGNGTTVNGEPNCMWEDTLTREQLVTVLYRFAKMMGKA